MFGYESGADTFSTIFTILAAVFGIILAGTVGYGIFVWIRNNHSPRETVNARVVTKRIRVSGHGHVMAGHATAMQMADSSTFTRYFATFELENGKRLEFRVSGKESGILAEGDLGSLTYQGTRYLGFDRA